ncbi:MAG: serine/threonine protein kinase, partial [Planctomycetia bacterium]|nr:serine/threonine protein kinase [Planctomycetia bacterium]
MPDSPAGPTSARQAKLEQILADYLHSVERGDPLDRQSLLAAHPDLAADLTSFFRNHDAIGRLAEPLNAAVDAPTLLGMSDTHSAQAGQTIRYFGDYELLDEIARGGMGVVFKARQVNLNRVVALKMILAGQLAHDSDVKRFYAEAEAAANLDHPGIVPIFEIGQHDGQHYFSMAFVEGESLARKVANGPLPPREAAQLVKQVAEAVDYAHAKGIIHRDLKPANVL